MLSTPTLLAFSGAALLLLIVPGPAVMYIVTRSATQGRTAGLVSVLGFTPDVFMGPLMGVLLDGSPGLPGHQHVFMVVAAFGVVGLGATIAFRRITASPARR